MSRRSLLAEAVQQGVVSRVVAQHHLLAAAALLEAFEALGRTLVCVTPDAAAADRVANAFELLMPPARVLRLPALEVSPYRGIAPSRAAETERLDALTRLASGARWLVVAEIAALARRSMPRETLAAATIHLEPGAGAIVAGAELDRDGLLRALDAAGYCRTPVAEDAGSYAVRGGLVDLIPPGARPIGLRLDFFGDTIESIRIFDPETQRTISRQAASGVPAAEPSTAKGFAIGPCREVLVGPESLRRARDALRVQGGECGIPAKKLRALLEDLDAGVRPLGLEGWLPAFEPEAVSPAALLPGDAVVAVFEAARVTRTLNELLATVEVERRQALGEGRLVFPVDALFDSPHLPADIELDSLEVVDGLAASPERPGASGPSAQSSSVLEARGHEALRQAVTSRRGDDHAFEPVAAAVLRWRRAGRSVVALAASPGHASRIEGVMGLYAVRTAVVEPQPLSELTVGANVDLVVMTGSLSQGLEFGSSSGLRQDSPLAKWVVLGVDDVVPHHRRSERRPKAAVVREALLQAFKDLELGAFVVHADYGVARYDGLIHIEVDGLAADFLRLYYRDNHVLYVPIYRLDRVQRYAAEDGTTPVLDKLGGDGWQKTKTRARKAAENIAKELVAVQAARKAKPRAPYARTDAYFAEFEAAFPYDETEDQERAIAEVMADMDAGCPMDRLVCGDVGFGKTEVAIRAAFRAVLDRRQVAVLVPTTVLAEQHGRSFEARLQGYPVSVAVLSRFRSSEEEADILARLASGRLDVVVGTHRMLSSDVRFKDLGLLIVDEEHRFGVKHKERLKQLKALVDVLTLTATPIPRTLNMAISGLRDMSVIATPPTERLAVRTLVARPSDDVLEQAIGQELARGGQVYIVHNKVESIGVVADRVQRVAPRARVLVGHGQMTEAMLERVMLAFVAGEADVLVATTIIESGLDIPNANTMVINRADQLGLAQLYQLRGRVGRSDRRAYCYLLVPEPEALDETAKKRIEAMQRFSELGAGFSIATLDMEIRGAGNLIGKEQHGHVKDVGLELFTELLAEAVAELQGEEEARPASCEMKVQLEALLPEDYLPDVHLRLFFYKRLASARTLEELEDVFADLSDRAGRPPPAAQRLREVTALKLELEALRARTFSYSPEAIAFAFEPSSPLAGPLAARLCGQPRTRWRLTPKELVRDVTPVEWAQGLAAAKAAVRELAHYAERLGGT